MAIFDERLGRIDAIALPRFYTIARGALISYYPTPFSHYWQLNNICLEAVPLQLARHNLSFVHSILELLYHSVPYADPNPLLFSLVWHALSQPTLSSAAETLIFSALIVHTGWYTQEAPLPAGFLDYLISLQPLAILKEHLSNATQQDIKRWLQNCLMHHPKKDQLKVTSAKWRGPL